MSAGTLLRRVAAVRTTDGAVLHAVVEGSDDAPVTLVLAHGWTLAQAAWDDVAELLTPRVAAGELRLIRYDQRGHGRSTWRSPTHPRYAAEVAELSIDQLGADLGELLDQLAPTGPLVLAGHSMGGMTIMCLAAARPELFGDRVRGVALVSTSAGDLAPAGTTPAERLQLKLAPGMVTVAIGGARALERMRRLLPPTHPRHQKLVRELLYGADATDEMVVAGAEIMHASTVRAFAAFYPALGEHDKRQELQALTSVPVEILVGESDELTPKRHSHQLAQALPDATLQIIPRTGHMLPQERAALVAEAIERLLVTATADQAAA
ncbi:alpha/beta fold hydrolase [Blastococcus saxobsidens]|uniref:Putative hydrolase or acyltransferase of alpha/beta superfamily n=1 Tax=Blastococcus saxobsidens (strain DD2) TaxID=1146883 RepID=H6RSU2_BLASD|nr:alpha/beta hydrolase [Blastococcus saxobsidens]CCG03045.1 Putative hydrolase or acyltransferase of alpha/beta superfamily [Blastococcus saxobsidens DD2]